MVYSGTTFRGDSNGDIVATKFARDALAPNEVLVNITHSGLCGTDLHFLHADIVLGHEGVGVVQEVGSEVKRFKVGDRAGWGYIQETCRSCTPCLDGKDQYCLSKGMYFESRTDQGSMGEIAILPDQWLFHIPESLSSAAAAPLMCGGSTVFTPLAESIRPTERVGVIGIGGLGHLAIQMASKMGCVVVVFSGTESKRDEAIKLGASEFYATKGVEDFSTLGVKHKLTSLLITTAQIPDLKPYFANLLAPNAKVFPLTGGFFPKIEIPYDIMIFQGISVIGSNLASRKTHMEMLEFCAHNKIAPMIEEFPMTKEGITEAVQKLEAGKMRYRGVLVAQ
ncbi:NADP-dependent alcohol dehydrogenase [Cylindrobasidium torrendii FP15055 ss-10]|uniref:NADP-dependent alcohol dehydrogenase n=1 Tax=Cylindrobasidium torrendii FP15055 ss-10 TaxID=1314674 RepID=A0A0D7BBP3_9AGAR|nr:NADP-dependent alcohol dehydrogenase [Cylindrobasidium torrendii FP15055 ss-10]